MTDTFKKALPHADPLWVEHGYGTRFQGFQNLMRIRVRDLLLVSSLYDLYVFEEDGRLSELINDEYQKLNLSHTPELTRVSIGKEAIALFQEERQFDLIITTLHIEDMRTAVFVQKIRELGVDIPIVLLAFDNKELSDLLLQKEADLFDQIFIWQGDYRLLLAIIKHFEDRLNIEYDTKLVGVQSIIIIENDVRYYSSFLPIIYREMIIQSHRLISDGINLSHKQLRQRARPKIILCKNYEQANSYFEKYKDTILGIISDVDFPRKGKPDPQAGLKFARKVKSQHPDMPILIHSTNPENEIDAHKLGLSFISKNSPTLLQELRRFMIDYLYQGDFIFRTPNGREVGRAHDMISLEQQLNILPEESIKYHAERDHFSNWLKARTEFWLAHQLRPRKVSDFPSIDALRKDLISFLREYRKLWKRGIITEFNKESFDPYTSFSRVGGGSLGGKARGLSFVNILINNYKVQNRFKGIRITIPPAIVLGTDVFDQFLQENNLREFALNAVDDREIIQRFTAAERFPKKVMTELVSFLELVNTPLAVRSSSLLEDSHNHPFAGVYRTYMLPNSKQDFFIRLEELVNAIKKVYASTFLLSAKDYIKATSYRLEEEKMAVIIQKMVGSVHNERFYPNFSGVAKSYNFYPIAPQKYSDGIVSVALGLGKMVVEGGETVLFCPKYPTHVDLFSTTKSTLKNSQKTFFALDLSSNIEKKLDKDDYFVKRYDLQTAELDGTLNLVASTYSPENDTVYDGISRSGVRLVTFAPILKNKLFPLNEVLELLLDMGSWGMGTPVEIEFSVDLSRPKDFSLLQIRPMVLNRELEMLNIDEFDPKHLICESSQVLGNGEINNIYDIVLVNRERFDRAKSQEVAMEVNTFNSRLLSENRNYLLIGVGRWGTLDPWLGIPVTWSQISGAKTIVETDFRDFTVMPSQGSHFFQNLNSFYIGYFTVRSNKNDSFLNWDWLLKQNPLEELKYTSLLRFDKPLVIKVSGQQNKGVILKPESSIG